MTNHHLCYMIEVPKGCVKRFIVNSVGVRGVDVMSRVVDNCGDYYCDMTKGSYVWAELGGGWDWVNG